MCEIPKGSQDLSSFFGALFKFKGRGGKGAGARRLTLAHKAGVRLARLWTLSLHFCWRGSEGKGLARPQSSHTCRIIQALFPEGRKWTFYYLCIYLFGVWIGVYDFIVSPEMKGRGAGCNCYLEPNLTDSCVPKNHQASKLCRFN